MSKNIVKSNGWSYGGTFFATWEDARIAELGDKIIDGLNVDDPLQFLLNGGNATVEIARAVIERDKLNKEILIKMQNELYTTSGRVD